jgi:hypothetical protein
LDNPTFQVEHFSDAIAEMRPHFNAHYSELAVFRDKIPAPDPDYALYEAMEAAGKLHVVTVRNRSKLIGYYVGIVMPQPHYKTTLYAMADLYWLHPDYRKGATGIEFIGFIESSLKERGVQVTVMGTKLSKDLGRLYEGLGYTETDRVYRKQLEN